MNVQNYYISQSDITNPGCYASYLDSLPNDIVELRQIAQYLVLHQHDGDAMGCPISPDRLLELETRYIDAMLAKIIGLNDASFSYMRKPAERFVGCCRDFSLLMCSFLRHKNIPARLRFGFSTFQIPGFHHDQVLLEYWDAGKNRWCLVDVRTNDQLIEKLKLKVDFDLCDVPRDKFITASEAWILCRGNKKNFNQFGTGILKRLTGWWYIRNKLIQDIAALNKKELLIWDCWGMMLSGGPDSLSVDEKQAEKLDYFAELMIDADVHFDELKTVYYLDSEVKVPEVVCSHGADRGPQWVNLRIG